MNGRRVETKRTYCRVCMTFCGLVADVAGDQIIKVRGDKEHPLTGGYTCPKGRATGRIHHLDGAITSPMMRKGDRLVTVSWDEALDDIAARLRAIIDTHGPHAVGVNFGSGLGLDSSGYDMAFALYKALAYPPKFSPITIDSAYEVMLSGALAGSIGLVPKVDYHNVELLIYVGINPMVSHGDNDGMWDPAVWIRSVAERGEIWTIDPVFTATANLSTRHIAPYPGKDYAILAWLTREIIDGGPLDPKQPIKGLEDLRAALSGYDRAKAAEIAGVAEQELEDLLAAIRRKGRVAIETGTGVGMSAGCNMTGWFAWLIQILTGSTNQEGGSWFHPGFFRPSEVCDPRVVPEERVFTPGSNVRPDVKGVIGEWPCAVLPLEIDAGNIRGLFNFGGSMLRSWPNTNALRAALPKLELNVNTEIVENELTPICTHVLPTKGAVERAEITKYDTMRWNVSLQYTPPVVAPMGERRSAWWVISQFMRRAGLPVPDHVLDDDREEGADDFMLSKLFSEHTRCTFEELKDKRYIEFPLEHPARWVDEHFERMGGWRLAPRELLEQWEEMRAADEAALGGQKPLVYSPRRQNKKFNAQLGFLGEPADVILHPDTAAAHGIAGGQEVRVRSKSGEIILVAKVSPRMRKGVASISHGHLNGNVNVLTSSDDMDPLTGMALYCGVPIEIEPVM